MIEKSNVTYCSGYWEISGNNKNSMEHYNYYLPETVRMISGKKLVFYYGQENIREKVANLSKQYNVDVIFHKKQTKELPGSICAAKILEQTSMYGQTLKGSAINCNLDKGLIHYWRDYIGSGHTIYLKILTVWLSKIELLHNIAVENPFSTDDYAWIDATVSRFNSKRPNWDFTKIKTNNSGVFHYKSIMKKKHENLTINASYLRGKANSIIILTYKYRKELQKMVQEMYPNDEETILHKIKKEYPDMFFQI